MTELDKVSTQILKQIIKHDNSIFPENFCKIKCIKKYSNDEVHECLDNLDELKFILLNENQDRISVTFKGKQYFLLNRKKWFERIVLSIVFPVIVALITALATTIITLWSNNLL